MPRPGKTKLRARTPPAQLALTDPAFAGHVPGQRHRPQRRCLVQGVQHPAERQALPRTRAARAHLVSLRLARYDAARQRCRAAFVSCASLRRLGQKSRRSCTGAILFLERLQGATGQCTRPAANQTKSCIATAWPGAAKGRMTPRELIDTAIVPGGGEALRLFRPRARLHDRAGSQRADVEPDERLGGSAGGDELRAARQSGARIC